MAQSIQFSQGIADLVKSDGVAREITGVVYDGTTPTGTTQIMIFLDGDTVRSVALAAWPAAQAALATQEADRQQAIQVKAQILGALQAMAGRPANGTYTAKELQALVMGIAHKLGGITKAGEIRPPGDWL